MSYKATLEAAGADVVCPGRLPGRSRVREGNLRLVQRLQVAMARLGHSYLDGELIGLGELMEKIREQATWDMDAGEILDWLRMVAVKRMGIKP